MSSEWAVAALLFLVGIVLGIGNVLLLHRTFGSLGHLSPQATRKRIIGGYLLRTALTALVLFLAVRAGPVNAVAILIGTLVGRGIAIMRLLRR